MFFRTQRFTSGALALVTLSTTIVLPGCGIFKGIGTALGLSAKEVQFARPAPAEVALPAITTIAVPTPSGKQEDAEAIGGYLAGNLASAGRFQVVERDRLMQLGQEHGCESTQAECVGKALPASAMVLGSVTQSGYQENVKRDSYSCGKDSKETCVTLTRIGHATVAANLRLVDTSNGKVLFQRMLSKTKDGSTSSDGNPPEAIDSTGLLDEARKEIAFEFFAAISPHEQTESVPMPVDGDLPELERALDLAMHANYGEAVKLYREAVAKADANKELSPGERALAHYSLAMGLAMSRDFDNAQAELGKAIQIESTDDWVSLADRMKVWKSDAVASDQQLALATAKADTPVAATN